MARNDGAESTGENWELTKDMLLEEEEQRKAPKGVLSLLPSSPQRAVVLLYALLALGFVIFVALTIANTRRVSAVWEALAQAQLQGERSHTTAWHNLSEVQHALDKQLSGELQAIQSQLLNASREMENMQWKMAQCKTECGKELSDRIRILEGREAPELALEQLAELRQEQSRVATLLSTALEGLRNLSEVLCTRCPAGWLQFTKTCYFFSTNPKPWMDANASCAELGGQLAIVDSELENKFLANHIMETRVFWLGLSDMHKEGDWQWLDGRSLSLAFWNSGEPNNVGQHGEDCATVSSRGLWNDATCSSVEAWVCERSC
ncbi:C-type lectin domain family 17, member A-like isoform X2 [Oxyura jamaicensis]|uniref:C-type lectin domain family 17, member A-like isoform X2 n=1 Tax=Oxyura jamaicensis TaxID=8884 RepID=UPI0015A58921|nr:C-type lectin domain family 17, member A-like isoform X2 [Oxyura jamaicensis]